MATPLQIENRSLELPTGRMFVHPAFDYSLIGGGLSLIVTLLVCIYPQLQSLGNVTLESSATRGVFLGLAYVFLLCNSVHFAASSVRLYTKPGTFEALPFLTMAFPLVCLSLLTVCMFQAGNWGYHLQALYLTWSPFHYAAQAYGLAVMYCYRSGCLLSASDKKWLWRVAMLPFAYTLLTGEYSGLGWIFPGLDLSGGSAMSLLLIAAAAVVILIAVVAPFWLYVRVWRSGSGPMPIISIMAIVANGIWFFVLTSLNAFVWATIFHGLQYLAIVIIFHVRDQMSREGNRHTAGYHATWFYAVSLALAYALFMLLPQAYMLAGFGVVESTLLVVAAINIHHFIVDAYIWRLGTGDKNRTIVDSAQPLPA